MKISEMNILLTGSTGGIGDEIAKTLLQGGAKLLLSSHCPQQLSKQKEDLSPLAIQPDQLSTCSANLMDQDSLEQLAEQAVLRGVNTVINNAGMLQFGLFSQQSPDYTRQLLQLNTLAPMLLIQQLLPHLQQQRSAQIINVGSTFGSIGYPGYVSYSASKSAIQGFSEALQRELADTNVQVKYLSPRATRTPINSPAVVQMNRELKVTMDEPVVVAQALLRLLEQPYHQLAIGWPEKLFIRINKLFPTLVDRAIAKQLPIIKRYALAQAGH